MLYDRMKKKYPATLSHSSKFLVFEGSQLPDQLFFLFTHPFASGTGTSFKKSSENYDPSSRGCSSVQYLFPWNGAGKCRRKTGDQSPVERNAKDNEGIQMWCSKIACAWRAFCLDFKPECLPDLLVSTVKR